MRTRPRPLALVLLLAVPCVGVGSSSRAHADTASEAQAAIAQIDALTTALDASSEHVRRLLRKARAQNWARGVACLDEALSRVDVARRVGREEAHEARVAAQGGNVELARAHLSRARWYREMGRRGASGGEMCAAGPELQPFEGTSVRLIVDPQIAPVTP